MPRRVKDGPCAMERRAPKATAAPPPSSRALGRRAATRRGSRAGRRRARCLDRSQPSLREAFEHGPRQLDRPQTAHRLTAELPARSLGLSRFDRGFALNAAPRSLRVPSRRKTDGRRLTRRLASSGERQVCRALLTRPGPLTKRLRRASRGAPGNFENRKDVSKKAFQANHVSEGVSSRNPARRGRSGRLETE